MDEKDLELLLTLYETKNITQASGKLYLSQPSLTKRLQQIEADLGTNLVLRSKRGIEFTPSGDQAVQHARKIQSELSILRELLKTNSNNVSGILHLGASAHYAQYTLPRILKIYTNNFPDSDVHVTVGKSQKLCNKLMNQELSLAMIRGDYTWKEGKILISKEPVYLIHSRENKNKSLSQLPYIWRNSDTLFNGQIIQWLLEQEMPTDGFKYNVDSYSTCIEMVRCGLGWTIAPEICLSDFDGVAIPLKFGNGENFTRSTYLFYREFAYQFPQVQAFINLVQEDASKKNCCGINY